MIGREQYNKQRALANGSVGALIISQYFDLQSPQYTSNLEKELQELRHLLQFKII